MRLSSAQVTVLRLGAVLCLLAVVPLLLVALLLDSSGPSAADLTTVDDPTAIDLPTPGVLGGSVVVYGVAEAPSVAPSDLGCVLLDEDGHELSQAKLSELAVLLHDTPAITVDGELLQPLFEVKNYPHDAMIACSDAGSAVPLAVSEPSTFGSAALLVRIAAAGGAVLCLLVGTVGLVAFRHRRV
jgi:hypothetical protein